LNFVSSLKLPEKYAYQRIQHEDRIKYIVEKLSESNFTKINGDIEIILGEKSPYYVAFYYNQKIFKKFNAWKDIFIRYCIIMEYAFFSKKSNRVVPSTIESKISTEMKNYANSINYFSWDIFRQSCEELCSIAHGQLEEAVGKLIDTIDALNSITDGSGHYREDYVNILIENYRKNDLDLEKWAYKICEIMSNSFTFQRK
jgi:hypothetical protein